MKVLFFAPKTQKTMVRTIFRAHQFKGTEDLNELIKLMCDPFLLCLFDREFADIIYADQFNHFEKIFGQRKILKLDFNKRESKVEMNGHHYRLTDFVSAIDQLELEERRKNLRIPYSLPFEIIGPDQKSKISYKSLNISTHGACITGPELNSSTVDLIINRKYTGKGKVCWQRIENDGQFSYGVDLELDEQEIFSKYIKKEILPSVIGNQESLT